MALFAFCPWRLEASALFLVFLALLFFPSCFRLEFRILQHETFCSPFNSHKRLERKCNQEISDLISALFKVKRIINDAGAISKKVPWFVHHVFFVNFQSRKILPNIAELLMGSFFHLVPVQPRSSSGGATNNNSPFPRCPKPARESRLSTLSNSCQCTIHRRRRAQTTSFFHSMVFYGKMVNVISTLVMYT